MRLFCKDFNCVNTLLIQEIKNRGWYTEEINEADGYLTWQDVRGEYRRIGQAFKDIGKPIFLVQHGRGATRDYEPPYKFELFADRVYVWGKADKERMVRAGHGDKTVITGSPLVRHLKPKLVHKEKRVLYCPIIYNKEEPENLIVYSILKEWECKKLRENIYKNYKTLKEGWGTRLVYFSDEKAAKLVESGQAKPTEVPHEIKFLPTIPNHAAYEMGILSAKLIYAHDLEKYQCEKCVSSPAAPDHIEKTVYALQLADVVVTIEEGTLALLAHAMNIPVIHADIFKYTPYGNDGKDYSSIEKIKTKACFHTEDINQIPYLIDYCLNENVEKNENMIKNRIEVVENELGPQYGDPITNILNDIELYIKQKSAVLVC